MSYRRLRRRALGAVRQWLLRNLGVAAVLAVVAAGVKLHWPADADQVFGGTPQPVAWLQRLTTHVINNPGFSLGYSEWAAAPLWVGYQARDPSAGRYLPRPEHFTVDWRTLRRIDSDDFSHSGYNRGHMAPNYLMSRLFGARAQRQSFRMSNIVPQTPRLNQLLWQRMEELESDVLAPRHGRLWVLMGPLYGEQPERIGGWVPVPEAFYRIWLREDPQGRPQAVAFIVPQRVCGDERIAEFVVPVAEVEARAGLDFFHALPPEDEQRLARQSTLRAWPGVASAGTRARYADNFAGQSCPYR